jgi:hypothetical protein
MLDGPEREGAGDPLFGRDGLPLYGRVIVGSAAGGTQPVHGRLDVVVAELAYLARGLAGRLETASPSFGGKAYLVAARTRAEVPIRQVELLDAERAALVLVIVDELVLVLSRHSDVWWCNVSCQARGWRSREGGVG